MVDNGKIPLSQMTKIDSTHYLAPGCAEAWHALASSLGLTVGNVADSCYRTYDWQVYRYNQHQKYPSLYPVAAVPGTSKHGLGMAVDIGNYYLFPHATLVREAKKHNFVFDTSSEAWHIKYLGDPKYDTTGGESGSAVKVTTKRQRKTTMFMYIPKGAPNGTSTLYIIASDFLYKESTMGQETAEQFAKQYGPAALVSRVFAEDIKGQVAANRAALGK